VSTVVQAAQIADRLDARCLLFDGSGAAIPPVRVDRRILVMGAHQPLDTLRGYFGPYRIRIADIVMITMCESPMADAGRIAEISEIVRNINPQAKVVTTVFRPRPCTDVPLRGKRVYVALTAPQSMGKRLSQHLEESYGVTVLGCSHALSNRTQLREDLAGGLAMQPDMVLTELKAASIDVVAELADQAGIAVGFLDNVPECTDSAQKIDTWLTEALALEPLRSRVG
jgi:cyclic 2,3-diphosphoglycerate synthetase